MHSKISKIVTGKIDSIRTGTPRIKITPVQAGLKVAVRGRTAQQTMYVYTQDALVEEFVVTCWEKFTT